MHYPLADLTDELNGRCINKLGELLAAFFEERRQRTATAILHDYGGWLLDQEWYQGPLRRR
jgi:hypothetical protein